MKLPGLLMVALLIQVPAFAQNGPNLGQFQPPSSVSDQFPNPAPQIGNPGQGLSQGEGMGQGMGRGQGRGGRKGRRGGMGHGQGMGQGGGQGDPARREQMKAKMMQRFDANHDGQLDAGERAQLRQLRDQRRAAKGAQGGGQGGGQGRMGRQGRMGGKHRRQNFDQPDLSGNNPLNGMPVTGNGQP